MKGKIVYLTVVEKEIEIPDEVVEISKKSWVDWTDEEDEKLRVFSENLYRKVSDERRSTGE